MSPEELNRTIEFIIQSQARLAAAQEKDREDRIAFEEWSKGLHQRVATLMERQTAILEQLTSDQAEAQRERQEARRESLEARREWQEMRREWQEARIDAQKKHDEVIAWLARILEKISDRLN